MGRPLSVGDAPSTMSRSSTTTLALGGLAITLFACASSLSSAQDRPRPMSVDAPCKLHYTRFHLLITVPPLGLLYLASRPFSTSLDHAKLVLLPIIAFVWTTPWDNELVRNGAWWYPKSCVLARIGYVPVEEYAFVRWQLTRGKTQAGRM